MDRAYQNQADGRNKNDDIHLVLNCERGVDLLDGVAALGPLEGSSVSEVIRLEMNAR